MKNFLSTLDIGESIGEKNQLPMKPYKGLSIYPKVIQEKLLQEFSLEEKQELTKPGVRWEIIYYYLNPYTKKFQRFKHRFSINQKYPKFNDRYVVFHNTYNAILRHLKEGHSPFDPSPEEIAKKIITFRNAIGKGLELKKPYVGEATFKSYNQRANQLLAWLKKKKLDNINTQIFPYHKLDEYFDELAKDSSVNNRNSALRDLKSLFTIMAKKNLVPTNYLAGIEKAKAVVVPHKSYTEKEAYAILDHLEKHDPLMKFFCQFIGYNFLRPVEICRLQMQDIDLENKTLRVLVKKQKYETRRIPNAIAKELEKLDFSNREHWLFTPTGVGEWDLNENARRLHFTKRFSKIKTALGFGEGYTMYSFRHTFATLNYIDLRKTLSKDEAITELMRYTGHETREITKGYISYIDADLVDEYDGLITRKHGKA